MVCESGEITRLVAGEGFEGVRQVELPHVSGFAEMEWTAPSGVAHATYAESGLMRGSPVTRSGIEESWRSSPLAGETTKIWVSVESARLAFATHAIHRPSPDARRWPPIPRRFRSGFSAVRVRRRMTVPAGGLG